MVPNLRRPELDSGEKQMMLPGLDALGGLVAGASIIGIAAGLSVADAQGADPQVSAPLPAAKPHSTATPEPAIQFAERVDQQPASSVRTAAPVSQTSRAVP